MDIEKATFKFNDVFEISFDLSAYKKEIKEIAVKYLKGELSAANDETGTGGFWDLAAKIIDDNCSFFWKFPFSCEIQDFLYMKLKEYAPTVTGKTLAS